jgi:hypothetical protein
MAYPKAGGKSLRYQKEQLVNFIVLQQGSKSASVPTLNDFIFDPHFMRH